MVNPLARIFPADAGSRRFVRLFTGRPARNYSAGFTLIELAVVLALIALIMGVALPQLLPAIIFSRAESAARHLAGYGKSAMAHAALMREPFTVKFDLKNGEYWAVSQNTVTDDLFGDDQTDAKNGMFADKAASGGDGSSQTNSDDKSNGLDLMGKPKGSGGLLGPDADPMRDRFEKRIRMQLEARAKKLDKDGILGDVGPLFDKPFNLNTSNQEQEQELLDPLLDRTTLPEGVTIETIRIGAKDYAPSSGEADIEFSAAGLDEPVLFYVKSEDDEYFTVVWDPITGTSHFGRGRQEYDPDTSEK